MLRYTITDRSCFAGDETARQAALVARCEGWAADGVDFIQVRERDLAAGPLAALARHMQAVRGNARLLINSRADVAVAVGAAGVHLTSVPGGLRPANVRTLYVAAGLPEPVVSVACHTLAEVEAARDSGGTLILFSPVFGKAVGRHLVSHGTGVELLQQACKAAGEVPVLALGGVTRENASVCRKAGAAGIAGIRLFLSPAAP